jgi:hypothetical protein
MLERMDYGAPRTFQQTELLGDVGDADGHAREISRQEHMFVRTCRLAIDHEYWPIRNANDALGGGPPETIAEAPTIGADHDEVGIPFDRDVSDCFMRLTRTNRNLRTVAQTREFARLRIEHEAGSGTATPDYARGVRRVDDMQQQQLRAEPPNNGMGTRHRTLRARTQIGRTQHSRAAIKLELSRADIFRDCAGTID